jgi:hypothetical protein
MKILGPTRDEARYWRRWYDEEFHDLYFFFFFFQWLDSPLRA